MSNLIVHFSLEGLLVDNNKFSYPYFSHLFEESKMIGYVDGKDFYLVVVSMNRQKNKLLILQQRSTIQLKRSTV